MRIFARSHNRLITILQPKPLLYSPETTLSFNSIFDVSSYIPTKEEIEQQKQAVINTAVTVGGYQAIKINIMEKNIQQRPSLKDVNVYITLENYMIIIENNSELPIIAKVPYIYNTKTKKYGSHTGFIKERIIPANETTIIELVDPHTFSSIYLPVKDIRDIPNLAIDFVDMK